MYFDNNYGKEIEYRHRSMKSNLEYLMYFSSLIGILESSFLFLVAILNR
jgi:hypothetical protein